jgi:putative peptidoglycan lipid II flippase
VTDEGTGRSLYRRMGLAAAIVAGGVLLSRVLGLVRQIVFAWILGAGATGDEYFVAFIIPDFLNYLLAGAYMAITLIPILTRRFARGDEEDAWRAFWAITRPLVLGVTLLVLAMMPLVPAILRAIEPGFAEDQIATASRLTRIVLPAQIFFIAGQLLTAVQFARQRFVIPTIGPIIYNVAIIAGGLIGGVGRDNPSADGFAWGALAGAFLGIFVLQIWGAWREGLRPPRRAPWRHPSVGRYFALAVPLMLGQSLVVLDEQLGRTFGSLVSDGGVSWLTFGRQTMLVPVGVIAQAAGVATYPFLASLVAEGRHREMAEAVGRAIRYIVVLSLAATALLMAASTQIVRGLYERGSFDTADTAATAGTLVFFALGIPMWGAQQIYARGFYAREEMWAPVLIGTASTIAAFPLYWWLQQAAGVDGLAIASTVAIAVYTVALGAEWYRRTGWEHARPVAGTALLALPGAVLGGVLAWRVAEWITGGTVSVAVDAIAVAVAGIAALGLTAGPPWIRRDLRRPGS